MRQEDNHVPEDVLDELTDTLAEAVGKLRAEFAERSEQVLAAQWRAGFADRVTWLDDADCYFKIAHALTVVLDVLEFAGEEHRTRMLPHIVRHWRYSVMDPRSSEPDDYGDAILSSFDKRGIPRPPQHQAFDTTGRRAAVFCVVDSIAAVHAHLGGGPLTDEVMAPLRVLCLAAHAVNAPDSVWPDLAPNLGRDTEPDDFVWPNDLSEAVVRAEIRLRGAISAAVEQFERMSAADHDVQRDLDAGSLGATAESVLTGAGIDLADMKALVAHRREYDRGGLWKRLVMGAAGGELSRERARILGLWQERLAAARLAVAVARADRDKELGRLARRLAEFEPGPESRLPGHLRQQSDYVGHLLAELGAAERVPHTLWTSTLLDDPYWRLPQLANKHPNVVLFTDDTSLPYARACAGVRDMVLDRLSRTAPGGLRLTWIDPVWRGQSAGPFREMLDRDQTPVWSTEDEITAALRRIGDLAEDGPDHVVVVTGFPHGFTEESARRLAQLTEEGLRVSVITVLDPVARSELRTTTSTAHPYPVFAGRSGGDRSGLPPWWGKARFPMGVWVVGHDCGPHAPIAVGADSSVWTPCEFPAFTAEAAAAIVDGYLEQTRLS